MLIRTLKQAFLKSISPQLPNLRIINPSLVLKAEHFDNDLVGVLRDVN